MNMHVMINDEYERAYDVDHDALRNVLLSCIRDDNDDAQRELLYAFVFTRRDDVARALRIDDANAMYVLRDESIAHAHVVIEHMTHDDDDNVHFELIAQFELRAS